ncbi:MAG: alpha/beta hydrolase [Proteobacteria bacterium]|nr:alpha/beta hydrolase [Pseudomonadota bacterium]
MFEGFERTEIKTSGARIHLRRGGEGPPLLLLHGNPQTHVMWHKIADRLAERFHVVATDLRGYGDSEKPRGLPDHSNYSFRAMAQDQLEVMAALGYRDFLAAGHDRGARTLHRLCLDHPERVRKAALLDILPSHHVWTHASKEWATKSWHWLFMIQPYDFPERMMASVPPEWFMERKIGKPGIGLAPFAKEAFAEYVRCFTPETIHGSCEDYRACAGVDFAMDDADVRAGRKVSCPVLVLYGAKSHTGTVFKPLEVWRAYADNVVGEGLDCGHYIPEERPEETLAWFLRFFGG